MRKAIRRAFLPKKPQAPGKVLVSCNVPKEDGAYTVYIFSQIHINEVCHANEVKFFAADVFGFYGFMFADLGKHKYVEYVLKFIMAHSFCCTQYLQSVHCTFSVAR